MPKISLYMRIKLGIVKVRRYSPLLFRFWLNVDKNGPSYNDLGNCWVWTGHRNSDGYGKIRRTRGKQVRAHVVSYELLVGSIQARLCVCHHCDNPWCVNPKHLFLGTHYENMVDRDSKGRLGARDGENNGNHKLTTKQVLEIWTRYKRYSRVNGGPALAREFGVTPSHIHNILKGRTWLA